MQRYAIIAGQGRSGTNWLLELLDRSADTFCRNEPNECPGSLMTRLVPESDAWAAEPAAFGARWDAAVAAALERFGAPDHRARVAKRWLREPSRSLGLYRAIHSPRFRALARHVAPSLGESEFRVPACISARPALASAFGVLKLNMAPGIATFVLQHRREVPTLHIVRHPGGFLHSWRTRYLDKNASAKVLYENRARLAHVARTDAAWAARLPSPDALDVHTSELLYWRYANETIWAAGRESPGYQFISYEQFARDPLPIMERIYAACGLTLTPEIAAEVTRSALGSREIAAKWRSELPADQRELVERVLRETPLPLSEGAH